MSDGDLRAAVGRLIPGRDLHIIGCRRRPARPRQRSCIGLRWASRIDLGFPQSGYRVSRRSLPAGTSQPIGTFFLPDTSSWPAFVADAEARRPQCGPYFRTVDEKAFAYLLPIIRLCDPRTSPGEIPGLVGKAADFFGDTHKGDAELAFSHWQFGAVPTVAALLQQQATASAIEQFYRKRCMAFLLVMALRFEYAVLFGLATDDPAPGRGTVVYSVQAIFARARGSAESAPIKAGIDCAPAAPDWAEAIRQPGGVLYPHATLWTDWTPPAGLGPDSNADNARPSAASWPKVPAALTALSWAEAPPEPNLIGLGPVLYRIGRFAHGAATAALAVPPALPADAVFVPLGDGEEMIRAHQPPHFVDTPGMVWPPLEGHYEYEVRGVDLLGVVSAGAARVGIRHHDDIAPPAPRAVHEGDISRAVEAGATSIDVDLRIGWGAGEDFGGPDVVEFRAAASFRPLNTTPLRIMSVSDGGPLHADLVVAALALPVDALRGALLTLPSGEYPIVSHGSGTPANLRVRKVNGRLPSAGEEGVVFASAGATTPMRVGRIARQPAVPSAVTQVPSLAPLEIELAPAAAVALPDDAFPSVYLHLLGGSFTAERIGAGRFRIEPPRPGTPGEERWLSWQALADPQSAMLNSPVVLFPPHRMSLSVPLPAGFLTGTLTLHVTAADGAAYVASPALPVAAPSLAQAFGNESARASLTLSLRSLALPGDIAVPTFDPTLRLWASSAANYSEAATYRLTWPAAAGAARYEVWRILETALPGATPGMTDIELRAIATAEAPFALRSDQIFGTTYLDALPGRTPVRALYRVRAVSPAGTAAAFSGLIGPVHVPDVRQPPAPNLLRASPLPPEEADRAVALEWTEAGSLADVRFEVWFRDATGDAAAPELAGTVPAGTTPGPGRRFRFVHAGRPPGRMATYYVVAVREALDPIDPAAASRRDIASFASQKLSAAGLRTGPLAAPGGVEASLDASGVELRWTTEDDYEAIEIRRRDPGQFGFAFLARIDGTATSYRDLVAEPGLFTYQVRAIGHSRMARGDNEPTVEIA
ncbi:MAG: hypothetical protein ABI399_03105 [Bauldia sp.]